jgi:hypothetical protein
VYAELTHNLQEGCCEVQLSTRNEAVISGVVVFDSEGGASVCLLRPPPPLLVLNLG